MIETYKLHRIISGGQTGIDQLGLTVAQSLGIPTGGTAPKGYLTENGPDEQLRDYGLVEHSSAKYPPRTRANVQQSDGTLLFGSLTGGTQLTLNVCIKEGKPYSLNPDADQLRTWLIDNQIRVLNVAGSRGSNLSIEQLEHYRKVLTDALTGFVKLG
ncbi:putative molybdenum carrier protein [Spirosoma sp. RP8]|uniref:Molybdenum carrier protein n=1 Tax=Spirosoma liriopis TaxID=2937440 RepID=A0ABT0HWI3_9BACT|nr:putative molybdenum carrier protein [Spirosoma liriopis]MCK8495875.1 putative molybdenum carrier protein [Spirosoma liriopis]